MKDLTFVAEHHYSRSSIGIEVPVTLSWGNSRKVPVLAKVDTGADFCYFQREYAEHLGIDVESGFHQVVKTAAGTFDSYGHEVTVQCFGWSFETTVYFAALPNFSRNVVGREGWLQNFRLGIIHHDSTLLLSRYED